MEIDKVSVSDSLLILFSCCLISLSCTWRQVGHLCVSRRGKQALTSCEVGNDPFGILLVNLVKFLPSLYTNGLLFLYSNKK